MAHSPDAHAQLGYNRRDLAKQILDILGFGYGRCVRIPAVDQIQSLPHGAGVGRFFYFIREKLQDVEYRLSFIFLVLIGDGDIIAFDRKQAVREHIAVGSAHAKVEIILVESGEILEFRALDIIRLRNLLSLENIPIPDDHRIIIVRVLDHGVQFGDDRRAPVLVAGPVLCPPFNARVRLMIDRFKDAIIPIPLI